MEDGMIQIQAQLKDSGSLEDGTRKMTFYAQEATPEVLLQILQHDGKMGWLCFSEAVIKEEDIPTEKVDMSEKKTPAQRMRGVLHVYYTQQKLGKPEDFEVYYRRYMEKKINEIKEKLI